MIKSNCTQCGTEIIRKGQKAGVFCSLPCKAEWQRSQKPVGQSWLYQKYVVEGLGIYRIGRIVERDPKRVYEWLIGYGIPTRPRGWNPAQSDSKPYWDHDWLYQEYITKQRSAADIASDFECKENNILYFLAKLGIPRRTISEVRAVKYWGLSGEQNGMYGKTGVDNPRWRGGCTPERQALYSSQEWTEAAKTVWRRDSATCQRCKQSGQRYEGALHIHHIVSFANAALRTDPCNLVLLCDKCHWFVHSKKNTEGEFLHG